MKVYLCGMFNSGCHPTFAMSGALAWQVKTTNKIFSFCVEGRWHGVFPGSPLSCPAFFSLPLSLSLSLSPANSCFCLKFAPQRFIYTNSRQIGYQFPSLTLRKRMQGWDSISTFQSNRPRGTNKSSLYRHQFFCKF